MPPEFISGESYGAPFIEWPAPDAPILRWSVECGFTSISAALNLTTVEVGILRNEPDRAWILIAKTYRVVQSQGSNIPDQTIRNFGGIALSPHASVAGITNAMNLEDRRLLELIKPEVA